MMPDTARGRIRRGGLAALALVFALTICLGGCSGKPTAPAGSDKGGSARTEVRVASLKGPTSIGLLSFMERSSSGETKSSFDFSIDATPDEIVPKIIQGKADIALIPANAASVLYSKTSGGVTVLDVNTLGVLSVVTSDESIANFNDLAQHRILMTGKGMVPEYTMNYLLKQAGIADTVKLEFKSQPEEVIAALAKDPAAVGILPQPFTTAALAKNTALRAPLNLSDVWDGLAASTGSRMLTGVTIVRTKFLKEHPEAVKEFLEEQQASVKAINADPSAAAKLVVKHGIIDSEDVARRAIPGCQLVCLTGNDMKTALSGYLSVLFEQDPTSVGGKLPADDFYYVP
ncbi:hypothetical protein Corgl_0839 [Coriobacterium glomerans PW2]|uniref:Uncharacterized protein n=1 Tax=Coriobacterium glomerans (strain ATCC 49209 / DSM 20642 / JCM 10262 / PW2) TaxID=700015 RepID=F2N7R0_CORGP|nr:ABC transporter substrate-binding protein [Coriobacterium glomerans]AEB06952.1 hypothetical protein Corgl_0839 [Coriobacterium glomerans PW2]